MSETKDKTLTLSDEGLRKLARVADLSEEDIAALVAKANGEALSTEVARKLDKARQDVERKPMAQAHTALGNANEAKVLSAEQVGEWLRGRLCMAASIPFQLDRDLDDGGKIAALLGQGPMRLEADGRLVQAIGPTVGSAGGYAVPVEMIPRIGEKADRGMVVWPLVAKYNTTSQSVTLPVENTVGSPSEGSAAKSSSTTSTDEIAETAVNFAEKTFTMRYADARVRMKLDMLRDSPISILDFVTRVIGRQFGYRRDQRILTGNGTNQPMGLVHNSGATAGISTVSIGAAITLAKLLGLLGELPEEYANAATAVMHRTTKLDLVAELAANVRAAQYLLDVIPPLKASSYVPKGQVLVGDFQYYTVALNTEMLMVTEVIARFFAMDIVFVEKWDGQVEQPDAFRLGTGITYS